MKKAPVFSSDHFQNNKIEIHAAVSDPVSSSSLGGNSFSIQLLGSLSNVSKSLQLHLIVSIVLKSTSLLQRYMSTIIHMAIFYSSLEPKKGRGTISKDLQFHCN